MFTQFNKPFFFKFWVDLLIIWKYHISFFGTPILVKTRKNAIVEVLDYSVLPCFALNLSNKNTTNRGKKLVTIAPSTYQSSYINPWDEIVLFESLNRILESNHWIIESNYRAQWNQIIESNLRIESINRTVQSNHRVESYSQIKKSNHRVE